MVLGNVGILIFINQDDAETVVKTAAHLWEIFEETGGEQDKIPEVHIAHLPETRFVGSVELRKFGIPAERFKIVTGSEGIILGPADKPGYRREFASLFI
jgi:hypothetical protein